MNGEDLREIDQGSVPGEGHDDMNAIELCLRAACGPRLQDGRGRVSPWGKGERNHYIEIRPGQVHIVAVGDKPGRKTSTTLSTGGLSTSPPSRWRPTSFGCQRRTFGFPRTHGDVPIGALQTSLRRGPLGKFFTAALGLAFQSATAPRSACTVAPAPVPPWIQTGGPSMPSSRVVSTRAG
jgi:hypothetical protein